MSNQRKDPMMMEIKNMAKAVLYLKGEKREKAKKSHYKILREWEENEE